jgi:hypothetical protein
VETFPRAYRDCNFSKRCSLIQTIKVIDIAPKYTSSMNVIVSASFSPAWKNADVNIISSVTPLDARFADAVPVFFRPWKFPEAHLHFSLTHRSDLDEAVRVRLEQP